MDISLVATGITAGYREISWVIIDMKSGYVYAMVRDIVASYRSISWSP